MAMRGRGGARGGVSPSYEDFKPNSEWQHDVHSHSLIISIPGFLKEQLRVSTESPNIIRVRGERLMADNKWSRFLEDFEVPENSDMNSVRARFIEGALTITVPKKTIDKPHEPTPPKKGVETHQDEKQEHSSTRTKQAKGDKAKAKFEKVVAKEEKDEKIKLKTDDVVASKDKGKEGKRKEVIESSGVGQEAFTKAMKGLAPKGKEGEGKEKEVIKSSGGEHEAFTKAMKGLAAKDTGKEGKEKEAIESSGAKHEAFTKAAKGLALAAKDKAKEVIESSGAEHGAFTKAVKGLGAKDKGKEGKEKEVIESTGAEHEGFTKAMKELVTRDKGKEEKKKVIESSGAEHGAFTKAVKGLAELNEERQLMVNMGVAVLVIVSFTAYVTCLKDFAKNERSASMMRK